MNPLRSFQKQLRDELFNPEHWMFLNEICREDPVLSRPDFVKFMRDKLDQADKVIPLLIFNLPYH